jgi:hypothetical protein
MVRNRVEHLERLVLALQPSEAAEVVKSRIAEDFGAYELILAEAGGEGGEDKIVSRRKPKPPSSAHGRGKGKGRGKVNIVSTDTTTDTQTLAQAGPVWKELESMRQSVAQDRQRLGMVDRYADSIRMAIRVSLRLGSLSQRLGQDHGADLQIFQEAQGFRAGGRYDCMDDEDEGEEEGSSARRGGALKA